MNVKFFICFIGQHEGWGIIATLGEGRFKLMCSGCTEKHAQEMAERLNRGAER